MIDMYSTVGFTTSIMQVMRYIGRKFDMCKLIFVTSIILTIVCG